VSSVSTTTESGSFGTGSFTASATSLTNNTVYYYRAYATNSSGTGHGSILSFTSVNTTPSRHVLLFEGFKIKLLSGKMILYQQ